MTDSPNSPTPEQVWDYAVDLLKTGENDTAQNGFLHWALLLDESAQAAWLKQIPTELHSTIENILETANTILKHPNDAANTWERLGTTWTADDRPDWAHDCFHNATQAAPDSAVARYHLGVSHFGRASVAEAQSCFEQATKLDPNHAVSHYNLGLCHHANGADEAAQQAYENALKLEPGHRFAGNNLANRHMGRLELDQAKVQLDSVIKQHPDHPPTRRNRAQVLLLQGDFERGWSDFSFRFRTDTRQQYSAETLWRGEPIQDKQLLVHFEQGLGDTIMFSRFLPQLKERCDRLTFSCQKPLASILKNSFPQLEIVTEAKAPDSFDFHLPLLNLGERLGLNSESQFHSEPYLKPDKVAALPDNGQPKVGLVWAGNPNHKSDGSRSIPWEQFKTIVEVQRVDFFNLQVGPRALDCGDELIPLQNRIADFSDTAAIINELDLVITVDTAVAHLAGALGKPTWILIAALPDWRWMMGRSDTPWYSTAKLYRASTETRWSATLAEVKNQLPRQLGLS